MNFAARDLTGRCGQAAVDITTQLGRGATATVYPARLNGQRYAAKIFHEDRAFPTAKIIAMLANPPKALAYGDGDGTFGKLAWPTAILSSDEGKDVGFLMPELDLKVAFPLDYFYDQTLFKKLKSPNEAALSFKLEIAKNLSRVVANLHEQGHCFIDMKPQNIRVTLGSHEVCLLDCDGFSIVGPQGDFQLACIACDAKNQVVTTKLWEGPTCGKCGRFLLPDSTPSIANTIVSNRFPAELLSTDYISPEAFRGNIPPSALGEAQDRYALAVLLFQLLNRGTHPFQGIPVDDTIEAATNDEKASKGLYPHGIHPHPLLKPRSHSIHESFDDDLRVMFDKAFIDSPNCRPTARDWTLKIEYVLASKSLARCETFPDDIKHIRFRNKSCPACYLDSIGTLTVPNAQFDGVGSKKHTTSISKKKPVSTESNFGPFKLILLCLGTLIAVFLMIGGDVRTKISEAPPSSTSEAALSCTQQVYNKKPIELCDLYWGHKAPHCDSEIRSEFIKLRLQIHPQESCGLPASFINEKPVTQDLKPGYFSIFVSENRATGWAIGETTQQVADIQAKSQCKVQAGTTDGETCKRIASGQAQCIAIAYSANGALGASSGKSVAVASLGAMERCGESGGKNCQVPTGGVACH